MNISPKLVAPKPVAVTIGVLVCIALALEVTHYQLAQHEAMEQVDQSLRNQLEGLSVIVGQSEEQHLSPVDIKKGLDRYCSLAKIEALVELNENDSLLYQSPNFKMMFLARSRELEASTGEFEVLKTPTESMRVYTRVEEPFRFIVSRSLSETESIKSLHKALSLSVIVLLLMLAPSCLIIALYWHRPSRALRKHIEDLSKQSILSPLPPIPELSHQDTTELVRRIHTIIGELHSSRKDALTFSSMASHEMRTPLTLIRNHLEVALASNPSDPSTQKLIASAYDEVLSLSGTVEDLLNLSTLQTGTANLSFTYFSLRDFLSTFYDEALLLTRTKNITIVLATVPQVTIEADAVRLRQVLFNLLDNAIKNTGHRGRIHITAETQENEILITFSDTGRGISVENISRIFEPFFRNDPDHAPVRGVGLGLPLVKWIIERHHGSVDVKSESGKGATFFIRIPRYHSTSI